MSDLVRSDPEILGGTPCVKGTRIPAHLIATLLEHGDTPEAVREAYPALLGVDLGAVCAWAKANPEPLRVPLSGSGADPAGDTGSIGARPAAPPS